MTVNNINDLESIFFDVKKVPATEILPSLDFSTRINRAIYIPDKNKIVNFCSDEYCITSNREIVLPVYEKLVSFYGEDGIKITAYNVDDRRFYISLMINNRPFDIQPGDIVNPTIEIQNSYDSSLRSRIAVGYNRVICSNGLMAFTKEYEIMRKHISGKMQIPNLDFIFQKVDSQLTRFKKLTDRRLTYKEMEELKELIKVETDFPKKLLDTVPAIVNREQQILDSPLNSWMVYNGFNNVLNHANIKMFPEIKEKVDREVLQLIEAF